MKLETIHCGECGIEFSVPDYWIKMRQEDGRDFWCPNGHCRAYRESTLNKLRREVQSLKQNEAFLNDRIKEEERRAASFKGQVTKLRKRAGRGVCPCCNRTFQNLQRHMKGQHPEWQASR